MTLRQRAAHLGLGIVLGLLVCAGVAAWRALQPPTFAQLAPTSPKMAGTAKEQKACTTVSAFKASAKKKLDLPEHVQQDEQASVLAAAPVPPSDHPRTATAVLRRDTGIGEIYLKDDPLPWLDLNPLRRWALAVDYGLINRADEPTWHIGGRYDFLKVKALRFGTAAHVFGEGTRYIGAGLEVKF